MRHNPGGTMSAPQTEPKTEILEAKVSVVKRNTGRYPFPFERTMMLQVIVKDKDGNDKVETWTPVDQDGRPISLAEVKFKEGP